MGEGNTTGSYGELGLLYGTHTGCLIGVKLYGINLSAVWPCI